jgi:hypothetical protein
MTAPLAVKLCTGSPETRAVCTAALAYLFYGPSKFITAEDFAAISRTWPAGVGTRNLEHWAQVSAEL